MKSFLLCSLVFLFRATVINAGTTWTVNCEVLSIQRSDPIVNPGVPGGHVHAIVGGTAFNRSMVGSNSAVNAKATTCNKFTDHSNYWCPQLYHMRTDGQFDMVKFLGANFYYQNYTCSYNPSGVCSTPRDARAFPPGFRMLAGDSTRRTQNDSDITHQAILFTSGATQQNVYGIPKTLGTNFQAVVRFPSCWDGKTVDSTNHKSHVSYPDPTLGGNTEGGMCPSSHPIALISIGAEFGFDIASLGITDPKSLVFANGDTTGYGFHGDFVQGWTNLTALEDSFGNCFSNDNCPWRAFGSPDGKDILPVARAPEIPAPFEEEIGLNGPIAKLPGNNPVYVAPA